MSKCSSQFGPRSLRTIAGMTLVELIMVVSIYTLLVLVITYAIQSFYQSNSYTIAQAQEVTEARRGLDRLIADLRELTEAEDGSYPLRIMEPHRLGFFSDIDRDAFVEYIEYEVSSTTLFKYTHNPVGSPPTYDFTTPDEVETISRFVQNQDQATSTFYYFDNSGTAVASTSLLAARYIRTQLIINIDPVRAPGEFMLRSSVAPRNLKDNL